VEYLLIEFLVTGDLSPNDQIDPIDGMAVDPELLGGLNGC